MKTARQHFSARSKARQESGLTLLEITVATGLLLVIVLGLTAMFIQTQKAFRSGIKQVDVFESGRVIIDMVARDLERLNDGQQPGVVTNFFIGRRGGTGVTQYNTDGQPLRTNELYDIFAISRVSSSWLGIGYAVSNSLAGGASATTPLVGTLYRYNSSYHVPLYNNLLFTGFANSVVNLSSNFNRIADGVIHFRVRVYDQNGVEVPLVDPTNNPTLGYPSTSNALPNYLEVEIGMLEPEIYERARALPNNAAQLNFLTNQASGVIGKVHIFRQQIPIRAAAR